jgi:6-phosphogluconolactonase
LLKTATQERSEMMIHWSNGSIRSLTKIVLPFSLALALAGCGSSATVACDASSGGSCRGSGPPEVLYGYASTELLNLSVITTIDPSTGGFGTISFGNTPNIFANSAAVASNGQFLYISNGFIDGLPNNGSQIIGYSISPTDGTLTAIAGSPFFLFLPPSSIQGLAITPNGQFLYGADFTGFIYAFAVDSATGALALVPASPFVSGPNPQLVVDPTGKFLYASNENDPNDSILAFTISPSSGVLTPVANSPFAIPGPGGGTSEPYGIVDTGSFVYAALLNQVAAFSVNSATGALTSVPGSPFPAGNGALLFAQTNNLLYVVNVNDGSISGYSVDSTSGALTPLVDSPFVGLNAGSLVTDPSGKYLYVSGGGPPHPGVQGYNIDSSTGALTLGVGSLSEGGGVLWLTTVQLPESAAQ